MVSEERRAARGVALHMDGTAESKVDVLDELGLIGPDAPRDENGRMVIIEKAASAVSSTEVASMNDSFKPTSNSAGAIAPMRDRSAIPAGLRNLPQSQPVDRRIGPRGSRHKPGSTAGRRWHDRWHEPLCDECREFSNEQIRKRRAARNAAKALAESEKAAS